MRKRLAAACFVFIGALIMDKTVPTGAAMLLDFIGSIEAPRGYNTIYGNNQDKLSTPVTSMTLAEIQIAQRAWSKQFGSSATGRYQFMRATLKDLIAELKLSTAQRLDADLQDRLGYHLLKRRGYEEFAAGKISTVEFAKRLAQEWASLPVLAPVQGAHRKLKRGQSYYAGDGLNKALTPPEKVEAVLAFVKEAVGKPQTPPAATPALPIDQGKVIKLPPDNSKLPAKNRFLAWLIDLFMAVFWPNRKEK